MDENSSIIKTGKIYKSSIYNIKNTIEDLKLRYKSYLFIIDCEYNFNTDEKNIIDKFNIYNINDLVKHKDIHQNDKKRSLDCYRYVKSYYKINKKEARNNYNYLNFEKYKILYRLTYDGTIKYCKNINEYSHICLE